MVLLFFDNTATCLSVSHTDVGHPDSIHPRVSYRIDWHCFLFFIHEISALSLTTVQKVCASTCCINLEFCVLLTMSQKDNFSTRSSGNRYLVEK